MIIEPKKIYFFFKNFFKLLTIFILILFLGIISIFYYKNNLYKKENVILFINFYDFDPKNKNIREFLGGYLLYIFFDKKEIYNFSVDKKLIKNNLNDFIKNYDIDYSFSISKENLEYFNNNFLVKKIDISQILNFKDDLINILLFFENLHSLFQYNNIKFVDIIKKIKRVFNIKYIKSILKYKNMYLIEFFLKAKREDFFKHYFKINFFNKEKFSDYIEYSKYNKNFKNDMILEVLNATYKNGLSLKITRRIRQEKFDVENFGNYKYYLHNTYIIDKKNKIKNLYKLHDYIKNAIYISFTMEQDFYDISVILGENSYKLFRNK